MSFFSNTWINGASSQVDVVGGGAAPSGCPLYFFDPANNDSLTIPSTTGDVTIVYATFNGLAGLNAAFTTPPVDSPIGADADFSLLEWNTETVSATAMTQLCDATFSGCFAYFVLDGVAYVVDQGAEESPYGAIAISLDWYSDGDGTGGTKDNSVPEGAFVVSFDGAGTPIQNSTVTITTDGTYDFGSVGPEIVVINSFLSDTIGQDSSLSGYEGAQTAAAGINGSPSVSLVSGAPFGRGVDIGREGAAPEALEYTYGGISDSAPALGVFHVTVDNLAILVNKTDFNSVGKGSELSDVYTIDIREQSGVILTPQIAEVVNSVDDLGSYVRFNLASVVNNPAAITNSSLCWFVVNVNGDGWKKVDMAFDSTYKKIFTYQVSTFPEANQNNHAPIMLQGINNKSGVKSAWLMESSDGDNADHIDFFNVAIGAYYNSGDYWLGNGFALSSNGLVSINQVWPSGEDLANTSTSPALAAMQREQVIFECFNDLGTAYGVGDGRVMLRTTDTERGVFSNTDLSASYDLTTGTPPPDVASKFYVDYLKWPAFVRGFSRAGGMNYYSSHLYVTAGDGARAGVWVADAPDRSTAKKVTPFTPLSWSSNAITAKTEEGFFFGTDLDLQYLWVTDASGDIVHSILIGSR